MPFEAVVMVSTMPYSTYRSMGYTGLAGFAQAEDPQALLADFIARMEAFHARVSEMGRILAELWHQLAECEGKWICNVWVVGDLLCDDCQKLRAIVESADRAFQEYLARYRAFRDQARQAGFAGLGNVYVVAILVAAAAVLWAASALFKAIQPSDTARLAESLRDRNAQVYDLTKRLLQLYEEGRIDADQLAAVLKRLQDLYGEGSPIRLPGGDGGWPVWAWVLVGLGVLIVAAAFVRRRRAGYVESGRRPALPV